MLAHLLRYERATWKSLVNPPSSRNTAPWPVTACKLQSKLPGARERDIQRHLANKTRRISARFFSCPVSRQWEAFAQCCYPQDLLPRQSRQPQGVFNKNTVHQFFDRHLTYADAFFVALIITLPSGLVVQLPLVSSSTSLKKALTSYRGHRDPNIHNEAHPETVHRKDCTKASAITRSVPALQKHVCIAPVSVNYTLRSKRLCTCTRASSHCYTYTLG